MITAEEPPSVPPTAVDYSTNTTRTTGPSRVPKRLTKPISSIKISLSLLGSLPPKRHVQVAAQCAASSTPSIQEIPSPSASKRRNGVSNPAKRHRTEGKTTKEKTAKKTGSVTKHNNLSHSSIIKQSRRNLSQQNTLLETAHDADSESEHTMPRK
ncbi:hypothetical protein M422DRAFT_248346 [Sphaerobolus stellatus SS14]|uniref:Uncharacterized protein n=1 Tax=Sphaerobolus stellatus (strain SS14) TaxID=990650 RepID=A0A0C9VVQ9_SPHS4|nr:hypothetical protein M422DRAFT_248346 [Sphaerobolus stellatus SS14]